MQPLYSLEQHQLNRRNAPLQRNKICADHVYGRSMGFIPAKFLKTPNDTPNSVLYRKRIDLPKKQISAVLVHIWAPTVAGQGWQLVPPHLKPKRYRHTASPFFSSVTK